MMWTNADTKIWPVLYKNNNLIKQFGQTMKSRNFYIHLLALTNDRQPRALFRKILLCINFRKCDTGKIQLQTKFLFKYLSDVNSLKLTKFMKKGFFFSWAPGAVYGHRPNLHNMPKNTVYLRENISLSMINLLLWMKTWKMHLNIAVSKLANKV